MRQVFLGELPRYQEGRYKDKIDWKKCIGYKIKFIYDNVEGWIEVIEYIKIGQKLTIKYNGKEFTITTGLLQGCNLGRLLDKHTSDFKIKIETRFKDKKRDMIITDRKIEKRKHGKSIVNEKLYKYKCNLCGFDCGKHYSSKDKEYKEEMWKAESNLLKGDGCSLCNNTSIIVKGINDIATTHPHLVLYFKNIEDAYTHTYASNDKALLVCPFCKTERTMIINKMVSDGFGCKKCSKGQSYPNKIMFNILDQLNIDFIPEYSPDWIKPRRYDFYVPSLNIIIEMDGDFHNKDNNMNGQTKEESKAIDDYKDEMAISHGILKPIRIDCNYKTTPKRFNHIKNSILNSEINKHFNLLIIDWRDANLKASKSSMELFYELLKKGNSREEIIKNMKIGQTTYYNYYNIIKKELDI